MTLLPLEVFHGLAGLVFLATAGSVATDRHHPRRWGSAGFWALLSLTFLGGKALPPLAVGYLVLAMVLLAAAGLVGAGTTAGPEPAQRWAEARRLGNRLFRPALLIPATAVAGSLVLGRLQGANWRLLEAKQATLTSLGLGAVLAIGLGIHLTGARLREPAKEGGRLLQSIGWALLLPQMLAGLGGTLTRAGVGDGIAGLASHLLPMGNPFAAVLAYCLGMAVFTICLGNAFAAFPVVTLGIGLPFVVQAHHGNPAIMGAVGMLCGYCGTLVTPMAANFNLVPAFLLELRDRNAVIKAQWPLAAALWILNVLLMALLVYRF